MRRKTTSALAPAGDSPLIAVGPDGQSRLTRGTHKGKLLSEIPRRDLTILLKRRYPHASDPAFLLNEHLTRHYGRPMTMKTAVEAMKEEHAEMQRKWAELQGQSPPSNRWLGKLVDKLSEGKTPHDADTWPDN